MWSREELKTKAKTVLNLNYWKTVLVGLVLMLVTGGASGSSSGSGYRNYRENNSYTYSRNYLDTSTILVYLGVFLSIFMIIFLISWGLKIFAWSPIEVGCQRFFIDTLKAPGNLNQMGFAFKTFYMNIVKIQFLRYLFIGLWSLLLIVPGIIKSYEYRMIPYLLAEHPGMSSKEAFERSREMMDGEKWNTFVLDLSFIGWNLLSACTCGILGVFYVNPYYYSTCVQLYDALKQKNPQYDPYNPYQTTY